MDKEAAFTPKQLYETLTSILNNVQLSEIGVSPYTLPEEGDPATSSTQSNEASSSLSNSALHQTISHSIRPFSLIDGDKLVIPQKPLYAVYGYAVKALSRFPRDVLDFTRTHPSSKISSGQSADADEMLSQIDVITQCILIQTPEHSRAINLRKKLILLRIALFNGSNEDTASMERMQGLVKRELHLTQLILGIAANAKMSPLWHHRRWLHALKDSLQRTPPTSSSKGTNSVYSPLKRQKLRRIEPVRLSAREAQQEIDLINVCAERYPRNYQAWSYRSWVIKGQLIPASLAHIQHKEQTHRPKSDGLTILIAEYEAMENYLSTHIADHTAATHLLVIAALAQQATEGQLLGRLRNFMVDFVQRYPFKETPWLLFRGVLFLLAHEMDQSEKPTYKDNFQNALFTIKEILDDAARRQKERTKETGQHGNTRKEEEDMLAVKYATRTLFYLSCKSDASGYPGLGSLEAKRVLEEFR